MRTKVKSNQFEVSSRFEISFRLRGSLRRELTALTFQTIARLYCMCKGYFLINANLTNAKQMFRYWLFFKQQ